jgi:hypothetical protein
VIPSLTYQTYKFPYDESIIAVTRKFKVIKFEKKWKYSDKNRIPGYCNTKIWYFGLIYTYLTSPGSAIKSKFFFFFFYISCTIY